MKMLNDYIFQEKKQQQQQTILHLLSLDTLSKTEKDVIVLKNYNSEINEQFDNCTNVMKNDEKKTPRSLSTFLYQLIIKINGKKTTVLNGYVDT